MGSGSEESVLCHEESAEESVSQLEPCRGLPIGSAPGFELGKGTALGLGHFKSSYGLYTHFFFLRSTRHLARRARLPLSDRPRTLLGPLPP